MYGILVESQTIPKELVRDKILSVSVILFTGFCVVGSLVSPLKELMRYISIVNLPMLIIMWWGEWLYRSPKHIEKAKQKLEKLIRNTAEEYLQDIKKAGYLSNDIKALIESNLVNRAAREINVDERRLCCFVSGTDEPISEGQLVKLSIELTCWEFAQEIVVRATVES